MASPTSSCPPGRTPSPLRLRRLSRGLTQTELAVAAGIPREQLGKIEAGRVDPHLSTIRGIAAALAVDAADLVKEESPAKATSPNSPKSDLGAPGDEA